MVSSVISLKVSSKVSSISVAAVLVALVVTPVGAGPRLRPDAPADLPVPIPRPRPPAQAAVPPASPTGRPADPAPAAAGSPAAGPVRQAPEDPGCPARLAAQNVTVDAITIPAQPDARCTVGEAVRLVGLKRADGALVSFADRPTLACTAAETFSAYVRDLLAPLAMGTYGAALVSVATGPGLECRSRDHLVGAKLSAHGQGLAVDIARLGLADGRTIMVGDATTTTDRAFERAARAGGCGYFHTALGPGSDAFHANHWHFDLEPRGATGQGKFCQ